MVSTVGPPPQKFPSPPNALKMTNLHRIIPGHHAMKFKNETLAFSNLFWALQDSVFNYRPQRSWGKVIFSEACVKNSVHREGSVCPIAYWDTHTHPRTRGRHPHLPPGPEADTPIPREQTPPRDQRQVLPRPEADTPQLPGSRHPWHSACWEIRVTSGR